MASYALLNTRLHVHVKVILSSAIQLDALGKQPNWVKRCRSFLFRICLYRFQFSWGTYPDHSQAGGKPQLAIPSKEVCKRRGKRGQRDPLSQFLGDSEGKWGGRTRFFHGTCGTRWMMKVQSEGVMCCVWCGTRVCLQCIPHNLNSDFFFF